jgi:hypothetical protein
MKCWLKKFKPIELLWSVRFLFMATDLSLHLTMIYGNQVLCMTANDFHLF